MARPREFDIDEALARAAEVFWQHGYEATSLTQLLDAMEIARGSLYKAFSDKHSIYIATLERYDRVEIQADIAALSDEAIDGAASLRQFLLYPAATKKEVRRRGCFLCNAAIDMAARDEQVEKLVAKMLNRLRQGILAALAKTSLSNRMTRQESENLAEIFLTTYIGLQVLAKAGAPATKLSKIALNAMRLNLADNF